MTSHTFSSSLDLAARPDQGGTQGRKIPLRTNIFALSLGKNKGAAGPSRGGAAVKQGARGAGRPRPTPFEMTVFHYDTVIDPYRDASDDVPLTGKAATARNERKLPISLLREVYALALKDAVADTANVLQQEHVTSIAFDGRRNAYTPKALPFQGEFSWIIALPKKESAPGDTTERDPRRKFKVTMQLVNEIDASTLSKFCSADPDIIRATGISIPEM